MIAWLRRRERKEGDIIPEGISWQRPEGHSGRYCLHIRRGWQRLAIGAWRMKAIIIEDFVADALGYRQQQVTRYRYRVFWNYVKLPQRER